jgi:hypothetical protein
MKWLSSSAPPTKIWSAADAAPRTDGPCVRVVRRCRHEGLTRLRSKNGRSIPLDNGAENVQALFVTSGVSRRIKKLEEEDGLTRRRRLEKSRGTFLAELASI